MVGNIYIKKLCRKHEKCCKRMIYIVKRFSSESKNKYFKTRKSLFETSSNVVCRYVNAEWRLKNVYKALQFLSLKIYVSR